MDSNNHKREAISQNGWIFAGFFLLIFVGLYVFLETAHPFYWRGVALGAPGALLITAYVVMVGRILKHRFQLSNGILGQLMVLFLLGHFLPFMMDDVGNVHLLYAEKTENLFLYTLPALLNFMLCSVFLTRREGQMGKREKTLWILAVGSVILLNPAQAMILMSLFITRLLFALATEVLESLKKEGQVFWNVLKACLKNQGKQLLWLPLWTIALILMLSNQGTQYTGIMDAMRTMKSAMLNMTPIFHGGILTINLLAVLMAAERAVRKKETGFFCWQLESLFCMGMTMVFLALLAVVMGDRYLVRPEVMIAWMGWLLMMTASSLAYIVKTFPKAAYFLPVLVYLVFCEVFLHYTAFADYQVVLAWIAIVG